MDTTLKTIRQSVIPERLEIHKKRQILYRMMHDVYEYFPFCLTNVIASLTCGLRGTCGDSWDIECPNSRGKGRPVQPYGGQNIEYACLVGCNVEVYQRYLGFGAWGIIHGGIFCNDRGKVDGFGILCFSYRFNSWLLMHGWCELKEICSIISMLSFLRIIGRLNRNLCLCINLSC